MDSSTADNMSVIFGPMGSTEPSFGAKCVSFCKTFCECIDRIRLIPRILITGYGYLLYDAHFWFKTLPDPTTAQQLYMNIIWGASAAWFGFYTGSLKFGSAAEKTQE